ncbi:extracellular dihydrogeodin oxidase [Grosmannia clavigera kw1407]|uniref:Extracellular dihydrogeodin oxidase n=1 Tax=Grosmannia clavigera (strain kw1407 / UAMH 11150) TaxID=655863 RepID=F0XDM4_GROCL|nr:extracellular dihydrogeodin oxidase [Grosmannia clavigera kw1407]EFX04444.1 extracellular dihydrogeodin oxidase [Grosmannia clavigera kw1407]
MRFSYLSLTAAWASTVVASPLVSRASSASCENTASSRSCWGDYNIATNYYEEVPDTGVTREYWFDIVNTTASPDGVERIVLSVNGTVPGPTIIADWGDTVVVHVTNSMENNGTGIHFHGIRQNYTSQMDGVPSVTQCPVAPGSSHTYTWRATQYGSSWYHSHFYVQAWDGVFGGIVINGPATADYDEDLGSLFLNDWTHETADQVLLKAEASGPQTLDNGLINGTNVYTTTDDTVVGSRFETQFSEGKRYRLRLVNGAADTVFKFTVDNHTLEVIATDFVPIQPYATDVVSITMGQRYDVIITANATTDDYWLRAIPQTSCSDNANADNIRGIVRYSSSSTADPTTSAWDAAAVDSCYDEDASLLVPYLAIAASDADVTDSFDVEVTLSNNAFLWEMGSSTFVNEWDYPTLQQVADKNDTWGASQNVYEFPNADTWVYWVIQTKNNAPHPLHMHGHDFWILGQGTGTYNASTANLSLVNRPRRDVVQLPGDGYAVIAFYTDNPGHRLGSCTATLPGTPPRV